MTVEHDGKPGDHYTLRLVLAMPIGTKFSDMPAAHVLCCSPTRNNYGSTTVLPHVTLDTRPSRFSACNIEKLGVAWGRGYSGF